MVYDIAILRRELVSRFGALPIGDIKTEDLARMHDAIAEDRPVMASRALRLAHHLLEWAATRGVIFRNPAAGLQRRLGGRKPERDRVLSLPELAALWHAAGDVTPAWYGALVRALILTGCRRGEVFQFDPGQVTLAKGGAWWTIPEAASKSGRPHRVWLTPLALRTLRATKFPSSASWDRLKLKLPPLNGHGSYTISAGPPPATWATRSASSRTSLSAC